MAFPARDYPRKPTRILTLSIGAKRPAFRRFISVNGLIVVGKHQPNIHTELPSISLSRHNHFYPVSVGSKLVAKLP
jgi:hypothetical protein